MRKLGYISISVKDAGCGCLCTVRDIQSVAAFLTVDLFHCDGLDRSSRAPSTLKVGSD